MSEHLPEPLEKIAERLSREFNLHPQQVKQLVEDGRDDLFERLADRYGNPGVVARTFLNHLPELRAEGLDIDGIPDGLFEALFSALAQDKFAKEAIPNILGMAIREGKGIEEVLGDLALERLSQEDVEQELDSILDDNLDLLRKRGQAAVKALMGVAMNRLRGRADGKVVSELLRAKVEERLSKP